MVTLYLAWRQPDQRWWPVGRLVREAAGTYEFSYTEGALDAARLANFAPILSFPDFRRTYRSESLFPMFANRIMSTKREEYGALMQALDLEIGAYNNPLAILARTGGERITDTFEVFPLPTRTDDGRYHVQFFVHGLAQLGDDLENRISRLTSGVKLELEDENGNAADPDALRIMAKLDGEKLGYVPRYFCKDIRSLRSALGNQVQMRVQQVNPSSIPRPYRILCELYSPWPEVFRPFSEHQFARIVAADIA